MAQNDIKPVHFPPEGEPAEPRGSRLRRAWEWTQDNLLPPYTGGSADTVFGIPFYDNDHYDKPWFQHTVGRVHRAMKRVDGAYYWVRYRSTRDGRFHVVYTDLQPGYYDVDEVMFRACFALLGRFVERELCPLRTGRTGYRGYNLHSADGTDEQAIDLWLWYREDLRREEKAEDADYSGYIERMGYDYISKLKDEKLRVLIDLRQALWT